jgi:hypothetical protein
MATRIITTTAAVSIIVEIAGLTAFSFLLRLLCGLMGCVFLSPLF